MKFRNVLFDFDGTLANTLPLTIHAMQIVFEKYEGRILNHEEIVAMFGPTEEGMIANNFMNKAKVPEAIELYFELYEKDHAEFVEQNDEIVALLKFLKEQGKKIGLITGKAHRAYLISEEKLGFKGVFDSIITGDDVSNPKPDPEGINRTLTKFEADLDSSIYIGDANGDIIAGKAAGIHTAAVQWLPVSQSNSFPAHPDFYWTKISQFTDLLKDEH
ncbi:HAD family hydrolase [Sporolactobacillus kofuensis]|uniref:HAD family hydrolase n=1 Tax=Sporolactobacillus kofuensis TaxID=269672 RepID=A0ABW1WI88_9BACL|nr:HAD family hydrolase [Sporolactobacillus kofuensis]MCO7176216.1 HAD family hydrolase [Sporolactobacillus kofuensis]